MSSTVMSSTFKTNTFKLTATALFLAATAAVALPSTASAESLIKPKVAPPSVIVPDPDAGSGYAGSWKLQGRLYNRFGLNVYLDKWGGGSYRAKVDGWETCNGSLSWQQTYGNKVVVHLASSRCDGPSGKWSADKMVCEPSGYGYGAKVTAPGPAYGQKLSCSYIPSAYYSPTWVALKRS